MILAKDEDLIHFAGQAHISEGDVRPGVNSACISNALRSNAGIRQAINVLYVGIADFALARSLARHVDIPERTPHGTPRSRKAGLE